MSAIGQYRTPVGAWQSDNPIFGICAYEVPRSNDESVLNTLNTRAAARRRRQARADAD